MRGKGKIRKVATENLIIIDPYCPVMVRRHLESVGVCLLPNRPEDSIDHTRAHTV